MEQYKDLSSERATRSYKKLSSNKKDLTPTADQCQKLILQGIKCVPTVFMSMEVNTMAKVWREY